MLLLTQFYILHCMLLLLLLPHHYNTTSHKQLDTLPVSVTDKQAMRDTIAKYQSKIVQHKKGLIKAAAASALATGTKASEVLYIHTTLYARHKLNHDANNLLVVLADDSATLSGEAVPSMCIAHFL
jgi:hypothetical protein